jgi:hypothetical protein
VDIQSDDAHTPSVFVRSKWELAATRHLLIRAHGASGKVARGRPCNELGLSARGLWTACPHLRAPGAPCPGRAHHIAISLSGNRRTARHRRISYRIMARPNASSGPACANGCTPSPTAHPETAPPNCPYGFIATIGIGPMAVSARNPNQKTRTNQGQCVDAPHLVAIRLLGGWIMRERCSPPRLQ